MPTEISTRITAADLRFADVIVHASSNRKAHGGIVTRIARKRVNAVVTVRNGDTTRDYTFGLDEPVVIRRYEQTIEEKEATRREAAVASIRRYMQEAHKQTLGDVLAQYAADRPNNPLDSWRLPEFLEMQAAWNFWMNVRRVEARYLGAGVDETDALFAAFGSVTSRDRYPQNPLSRSTSTMSNILDDLNLYVIDKARQRVLGWGGTIESDLTAAMQRADAALTAANEGAA